MQPSPTTALIALLGSTAGSLTGYYTPALIPGVIFGVLAYALAVVGLAAAFRQDRDATLTAATLLVVRVAMAIIETFAGGLYRLLAAGAQRLAQHQTEPAEPAAHFIHAA